MGDVRDLAEQLWNRERAFTGDDHPLTTLAGLEELEPGLAFVSGFANVTALEAEGALLLIDTGGTFFAETIHAQVRGWSQAPVRTAVYTHGHVDHAFGLGPFEAEGGAIEVIAHEALPARFDRYQRTKGYNAAINARQFRVAGLRWPDAYRYPDRTYREQLTLRVGDEAVELRHDKGETDDHTWAWLPARRAICTGDLFIWAAPNCGNPQKVQRFPREWAAALRKMHALGAETLLPGHGPPIFGAERVAQALDETATLLETLHDQTLALMNEGARLNDILHAVEVPAALLARPYLRPVYDDPLFIVRNVWRLYGGWYDGNPANLKPPRDDDLAEAIAGLAGGADALCERAAALAQAGRLAVAAQLIEHAARAGADPTALGWIRKAVYMELARRETSLMAKSIYRAAADGES